MKALMAIQVLLFCAMMAWTSWMFHESAVALKKASDDFRDAWQSFYVQEHRANYELEQLAKDRIRIRELLKRMEKKNGAAAADKPEPRRTP